MRSRDDGNEFMSTTCGLITATFLNFYDIRSPTAVLLLDLSLRGARKNEWVESFRHIYFWQVFESVEALVRFSRRRQAPAPASSRLLRSYFLSRGSHLVRRDDERCQTEIPFFFSLFKDFVWGCSCLQDFFSKFRPTFFVYHFFRLPKLDFLNARSSFCLALLCAADQFRAFEFTLLLTGVLTVDFTPLARP